MAKPNAAEVPDPLEEAIDQAIATCDGDVRAALRATLIANAFLEAEVERLCTSSQTYYAQVSFVGRVATVEKGLEYIAEQ